MAKKESKEIVLRNTDVASFIQSFGVIEGDPIFNGLVTVYNYGVRYEAGNIEEAKKLAYEHRQDLGDLWRRIKENAAAEKVLKPLVEKIAADVAMPDVFKWQAGAKKSKKTIADVNGLWAKMEAAGITLEAFLGCCDVDFDKAVELSGMNENNFLETWGDVVNVEQTQNKPSLKGLA